MQDLGNDLRKFGNPSDASEEHYDVHITKIIAQDDPRAISYEMTAAKRAEIKSLLEPDTFKFILKEEVPPDGNIIPCRVVLPIKSTDNGKVKFKASYVIRGHQDNFKD